MARWRKRGRKNTPKNIQSQNPPTTPTAETITSAIVIPAVIISALTLYLTAALTNFARLFIPSTSLWV